jgi:hypothetical protein
MSMSTQEEVAMKQENFNKLQELIVTALLVNVDTPYCVFSNDSGHVSHVGIKVCKSKNDWDSVIIRERIFSYDQPWSEENEKHYEELKTAFGLLLAGDYPSLFKVEVDTGINIITELFSTEEERQEYVANAAAKNSQLTFKESMEILPQGGMQ